mgnify:CR=1 FL=1
MSMKRRDFLKMAAVAATASLSWHSTAAAETRNGMPYRTLGKTGEAVSLLCVGGYHIGMRSLSDEESVALMRTAVDEGVNFFDNAWSYHGGVSERRMGQALKDGYRDKVFLMTKVNGRTAQMAESQLNDCLTRLDVDVIDLLQVHEVVFDEEVDKVYDEVIEVIEKARDAGKIRHIGFTGHNWPRVHRAMIERGYDWKTVQMPLNVFDHHFRSFEQEILPMARERNMGVIGMKTSAGGPIPIGSKVATALECLRYTMGLPGVSSVCSGMATMEHLRENIALAKSFQPYEPEELASLLERTYEHAMTGEFEPYKTRWHAAREAQA